jgi:hypothetical protein
MSASEREWLTPGLAEDLSMLNLGESRAQILNQEYCADTGYDEISINQRTGQLVDVIATLAQARLEAEGLNDKLFLYMIDAAIFHAYEVLERHSDLGEREKWS